MSEADSREPRSSDNSQSIKRSGGTLPRRGELVAFIRYQLSKMRARNEHHRFEDLCRSFSRQKIASNIIPATGPVSAGGDQGRDFETFLTYIKREVRPFALFLGVEDGNNIVFCCSLQESAISSKILSDIRTVCASRSSLPVDGIVYFTEADVPVGLQHNLIESVVRDHGVRLNIIDGTGLSELLSEPESIWIANEYLNVSLDLLDGSKLATATRELFATGDIVVRPLRQLDPIRDMGIHPPLKLEGWSGLPEYVPRSIDADLDAELDNGGLLVVEGGSASGKTRTAYEAILRGANRTGERPVIIAKDGQSLRKLIAAGYSLENSIVWLDDLERFIGSDGVDDGIVKLFSVSDGGTCIATLRSRAKVYMEAATAGPPGRSLSSISRTVLAGAKTFRIDRHLNLEEQEVARGRVGDPRILAAVSSKGIGFAEHIAAAPATLARWKDGQDGASEVGAALVSAAIDLRRAGYFSPIAREWLIAIYGTYLDRRIRGRVDEEQLNFGFAWAIQMVSGASSCLEVVGNDLFSPFDYLVDFVQQEGLNDDEERPSRIRQLYSIPDLVWHELADRISINDPSYMSCVSMSSLSLHPALKLVYDWAVSAGRISSDSLKDRGVLLNFVRSCQMSNLCIVCLATLNKLDIAAILGALLEECAPVLVDQELPPTQSQIDSVWALASMGQDANLRDTEGQLHIAALQTPSANWVQLGKFMLSKGIEAGQYWVCFAELQEGKNPVWPENDSEARAIVLPMDRITPDE